MLVQAKRKMFLTEDSGSDQGRRIGKKPTRLVINEEGMKSIIHPQYKVSVSPERRKTVHMAIH